MNKYNVEITSADGSPEGTYHVYATTAASASELALHEAPDLVAVGHAVTVEVKVLKVNLTNRSRASCKRVQ